MYTPERFITCSKHAIAYCQPIVSQLDWMVVVGGAAATATPKYIVKKLVGEPFIQHTPGEGKLRGALGMLDVAYCGPAGG
jgi:hypothetical protein